MFKKLRGLRPKKEDIVTVRRLFHISTWTSTLYTLAINISYPSFSCFSFSHHRLDKARRCHRFSCFPRSNEHPPSQFEWVTRGWRCGNTFRFTVCSLIPVYIHVGWDPRYVQPMFCVVRCVVHFINDRGDNELS